MKDCFTNQEFIHFTKVFHSHSTDHIQVLTLTDGDEKKNVECVCVKQNCGRLSALQSPPRAVFAVETHKHTHTRKSELIPFPSSDTFRL